MVPEQTLKVLLTGSSVFCSWSPVGGSVSYKRAIIKIFLHIYCWKLRIIISFVLLIFLYLSQNVSESKGEENLQTNFQPMWSLSHLFIPNITIKIILLFNLAWDAVLRRARGWREGQIEQETKEEEDLSHGGREKSSPDLWPSALIPVIIGII